MRQFFFETFPNARFLHVFILFSITIVLYSNTLAMAFVWDDLSCLEYFHRQKVTLSKVGMFFQSPELTARYYRPAFYISLAIDYANHDFDPHGYHLTNLIMHLIVIIFLYGTIVKLFENRLLAFMTTLLFSVHPTHSEVVTWISGRSELLFALFLFGSFFLFLSYLEKPRPGFFIGSLGFFLGSLFSKESASLFPFMIGFYFVLFPKVLPDKRNRLIGSYFGLLIAYWIGRSFIHTDSLGHFPFLTRLSTATTLLPLYIKAFFWPFDLRVFYDLPIKESFFDKDVLTAAFWCLIIFSVALWVFRKQSACAFGISIFFIFLFPVSGIIALIQSPALMCDRYLYVPSAGLSLCLCALFFEAWNYFNTLKYRNFFLFVGGFSVFAFISIIGIFFKESWYRNYLWDSNETLMKQITLESPKYTGSYINLGREYLFSENKDLGKAEQQFLKALAIDSKDINTLCHLSTLYSIQGRYSESLPYLRKAQSLDPKNPDFSYFIGTCLTGLGNFAEAAKEFEKNLQTKHSFPDARYYLGYCYQQLAQPELAVKQYRVFVDANPNHAGVRAALGKLYFILRNQPLAEKELVQAATLAPHDPLIPFYLGLLSFEQQKSDLGFDYLKTAGKLVIDRLPGTVFLGLSEIW